MLLTGKIDGFSLSINGTKRMSVTFFQGNGYMMVPVPKNFSIELGTEVEVQLDVKLMQQPSPTTSQTTGE